MKRGRHRRPSSLPRSRGWTAAISALVLSVGPAAASGEDLTRADPSSLEVLPTSPRPLGPPLKPSPSLAKPKPQATTGPGLPRQIAVPQLSVVAPVIDIGVRGGALIPPSDPRTVGWWSAGSRPGAARGSAVLTGHTVHNGGGAFDDLESLRPGAEIVLTTSRGELRYRVTSSAIYRKQALADHAAMLFDQTVAGRLVLVTCEDWNGTTYLSNVVVTARLVQ
ncbi:class F sortase [Kribbella sp. NBC_01505]|uniref:class F sortase n=1 Tax=Kribbella sp. NBC_01505 TaxID=2903580 RepID=UPI00386FDF0D